MSSSAPVFLQTLPSETDATDGDIVTFQVKLTEDLPLRVTWLRCGEELRAVEGHREVIEHCDGWHELIISNITEDDDGEYECRAENAYGHASCFGSLYYYQEGGACTVTDVTLEGTLPDEGNGRQSGLLILIDDGSHTEEEGQSGETNRKSMTVSEQMQGIIEDLTQSTQGDHTGSITLEKDDDQFNSDIDIPDEEIERHFIEDVFGNRAVESIDSQSTLVPEVPSPDSPVSQGKVLSEGASDPFASKRIDVTAHMWKSTPGGTSSQGFTDQPAEIVVEPDNPTTLLAYPQDTTTIDVLPLDTEFSTRTLGADTPFDVADISEETADTSKFSLDGATSPLRTNHRAVAFQDIPSSVLTLQASGVEETGTLSASKFQESSPFVEGSLESKMSYSRSSFRSSTFKYAGGDSVDEHTSMRTSSVTSKSSTSHFETDEVLRVSPSVKSVRTAALLDFEDDDDTTVSHKRTKTSVAYEADESSVSVSLGTSGRATTRTALLTESFASEATEARGLEVYVAIMDFIPMESDEEAVPMKEGQQIEILDASKPRRWFVRTRPMSAGEDAKEGWVPACYLEKPSDESTLDYLVTEPSMDPKELEALENREAVVKELVETEEDFAKDMQFVVDHYYKEMDNPKVPKEVRDRKGSIFGNFKDICDFHNNVLMKGVHYHSKEPTKLGKTFLRLERDFDMHANYCWNEARAQQLLQGGPLKDYLDEHSRTIDDDKTLAEHLKLPIQRLNDYQLLLKEIIKYSGRLQEDTGDLQKALDFIHSINKRTKDLELVKGIRGCSGDLLKLGKVVKHDVFDVTEGNQDISCQRHVFLFKGRIFIAEKRTESGKDFFHVTNLFKIQDVQVEDHGNEDPLQIIFKHSKKGKSGFPLILRAKSQELKDNWSKELSAGPYVEDLGEQEPALLVTSEAKGLQKSSKEDTEPKSDYSLKTTQELKHKVLAEDNAHPCEPEVKKSKISGQEESVDSSKKEKEVKKLLTTKEVGSKNDVAETAPKSEIKTPRDQVKNKNLDPQPKDRSDIQQNIKDKAPSQSDLKKKQDKTEQVTSKTEDPGIVKTSAVPEDQTKDKKSKAGKKKQEGPEMDTKPTFSKTLRGATCSLGETVSLECETEGTPSPSVLWLKDNQKITKSKRVQTSSKQQKHSLVIKDVTNDDAGLYTVVASNSKGSASCSAPLNLKMALLGLPKEDSRPTTPGGTLLPQAPVFKVKLNKDTQLLEGTCVRFELVVRGNPEPTVKFLKDNKPLKQDERVRVAYENKEVFELIIDHVVAKDAGCYSCVATNSEGSVTTTGNLTVTKNKDVFKGLEEELLEEEREPTPRPRTPKFKWFKNGQDFEASERFQVMFNEQDDSLALLFQHVTPEDAGLYTCVASTSTGSKIACSAELTVQGVVRQVETPAIKAELGDVEATEGGSAMLELKVTGYPKPKVTWFHKKKEVTSGGRFRFLFADEESFTCVIKNVKKEDGGQYTVKASNEVGEVESSCQMTVKSAPAILKGLKDMSVMADEVMKFEVEVDGNPNPEIKWYKDGQQLAPTNRIQISSVDSKKHRLQVLKCNPDDSGSYSCVITNSLGSQAEFSNVVVKASPTFVKEMKNVEGLEGDALQFFVEVAGNPKPSLKWSKDGKDLKIDGKHIKVVDEGAHTYSFIIDKATASDIGVYTCELRNDHGLKSSSGNLALKTKPEFVKKLSDTEAKEGDTNLELCVTIKGYPYPSVKWMLDDVDISENKNYVISSDAQFGSHALRLKKVHHSLSGKYSCNASNTMGIASTTGNLAVSVSLRKPEFDLSLTPTQLVEGKFGKLVAKVSGEPKPKTKWLKNGKAISEGEHLTIQEEPDGTISLLIDNVRGDDSGIYKVVAVSTEGEDSCEAQVTTIPPGKKPEFLRELEKVNLMEGQPLKLQAKVTGNPTSIKWQKDGNEISASDHITLTDDVDGLITLIISEVHRNDEGKYTVIATNAEGKARSAALVGVKAVSKPEVLLSLKPLTLTDGESGLLKVKISGEPKPNNKWLKDGKELKPSNRIEATEGPDGEVILAIKNARPEDAGVYTIVASNFKGEIKNSVPVVVNKAPTFQKQLEPVEVVEGYPARLEARLSGSPPPVIKWLKDGKEILPDGQHLKEIHSPDGTIVLLVEGCRPQDVGKYSLIAKNPLGEISTSSDLAVSAKSDKNEPECIPKFLEPIGDLSVKEGESIRFEAAVSGNPLPDISWSLNSNPVKPSDDVLVTFDGKKAILEIKNCTPDHMGKYQCNLSNPVGVASSEGTALVQEKTAPRFVLRLSDFNGFIGQPLKMACKVNGYPNPEVDWYFNGDRLDTGFHYNISRIGDVCCLAIAGCNPSDSGIYECRASNSVGEDHTRATASISDKVEKGEAPMFLKKIGDNEVMEGMTARFTACITGIPTPEVKWTKDGQPLELSPRLKLEHESTGILRLIVRDVEPADYGEYNVVISNIRGSATSSAHLRPDSLDQKYITPIGDQFVDFEKFKKSGAPVPLPDKPRFIRMDDYFLTLGWQPSVPNTRRFPVTYQIEMAQHPSGEWTLYKAGLKDTLCDVRELIPGKDYKFRIRVENKFGVSDPSPYATAHRSKMHEIQTPANFIPKDYEIDHPPLEKYAAPPRFLHGKEDIMYGIRGHPITINSWVYGHPEPQIHWYKDGLKIEKGKYDFLQEHNGKLSVFINFMSDEYVGTYLCIAENGEGEAKMKIKLLIAEAPIFIQKLDETAGMIRRSCRIQCRATGLPYPKIKWYRDWHPLYESDRVKILWEEPDVCTLFIGGLISRDAGFYSCSACNIAGYASTSGSLTVEDSEDMFDIKTYNRPMNIKPRIKSFDDFYDIGDELGRGTQGITYHAVKRDTGNSFAVKMMKGRGKLKDFMKNEMDVMNQISHPKLLRLHDAFETKDSMILLCDICGGDELLVNILKRDAISEREIAYYIKQLLQGLDHMHSQYLGHLGLTIGDMMVSRVNSHDIKVGDFGLSARLIPGKDYFLEYGHPEFVAPEIANKLPATLLSDMWSVGVITYLLLSGISPFLGQHDRETLSRVQQGKISFSEEAFSGVTDDAKDFMAKLLVFEPSGRMNVKNALQHKWIKYYADIPSPSDKMLKNISRLKEYHKKWRDWYANASCRNYYRRRTLESCFHHPSKMIYPPGEVYTPETSPERELDHTHVKPSQFDDITFKQKINREDIEFRSESNYQNGPDTYLLQLRDTDFPLRLRQYLRVGASTSPSLAANLRDRHWGDSTLVVRERRKFVDIMDEEIGDERKGLTTRPVPRRLYHETGTLGYAHEQMELLKNEVWKDRGGRESEIGSAPYFREVVKDTVMKEGEEIVLHCYAVGTPKADYSWFRNDGILLESSRIVVKQLEDGRCELRINPSRAYDVGIYKCVARNLHGVTVCRARLKIGDKPGRPEPPVVRQISDTEIYLTWSAPRDEGQSPTLRYALDFKKQDSEDWTTLSSIIGHEFFVVRDLIPSTSYLFRVQARNKFGWGEAGFSSDPIGTKSEGAEKVKVSIHRKYQQEMTEQSSDYDDNEADIKNLDYSRETNPVPLQEGDILELYRIISETSRGRFSVVLNVWVKESGTTSIAKVMQSSSDVDANKEYDILKSLCHEKIVTLLSASRHSQKTVLIMEKLSGVDVLTYLSVRQEYNEELVVKIIKQILEALEYLHFRSICYIELQPDNVVMIDQRHPDIKLVDFGAACVVPKTGRKISFKGSIEYLAPEVLKNEEVSTLTDVWCVGVITYILLSGISPFKGKTDDETKENVTFVRYEFENLYSDITMEATRFLLHVFKSCPIKRATIAECLENKWLMPSEYMIMKRESARFLPDKLFSFAKDFHASKADAMNPEMLTSLGMSSTRNETKEEEYEFL